VGHSSRVVAGAVASVALLLLVLWKSETVPDRPENRAESPSEVEPRDEPGREEPEPPTPIEMERAGCFLVVDESGRPLSGLGSEPDLGARAAIPPPGEVTSVWLLDSASGAAWCVNPNRVGQVMVPELETDVALDVVAHRRGEPWVIRRSARAHRVGELPGRTLVLLRSPSRTVNVSCSSEQGDPLVATIRIERITSPTERFTMGTVSVPETGPRTIEVPVGGSYTATLMDVAAISNPTYIRPRLDFDLRDADVAPIAFVVPVPAQLRISVVSESGASVPQGIVNLLYRDAGVWREHPKTGRVDQTGTRIISGLLPGPYIVQAVAPGMPPRSEELELSPADERYARMVLREGGVAARGVFRLGADVPKGTGIRTAFLLRRGRTAHDQFALWTGTVTGTGVFGADGLSEGEWELNFSIGTVSGLWSFGVNDRDIDLGEMDVSDMLANGPGRVSVSLDGRAPHGYRVKVLLRNIEWPQSLWRSVNVNVSGAAVEVSGLPPGHYDFALSPAAIDPVRFDISDRKRVLVRPEGPPGRVELLVRAMD
jgi:hypothetical protein